MYILKWSKTILYRSPYIVEELSHTLLNFLNIVGRTPHPSHVLFIHNTFFIFYLEKKGG